MIFEEFKHEIVLGLGGGLVDVEYECEELNIDFKTKETVMLAFNKAKRIHQQRGNHNAEKAFAQFAVEKGKQLYDLPPEEQGKIRDIIKIIRVDRSWNVDNPFHVLAYNEMFGTSGSSTGCGGSVSWVQYELTLQQLETAKRYTAYDMQFIHKPHKNTIELLKKPDRDAIWLLECYKDLEDEEYMDNLWIQEYALSHAKHILGMAYRKFQSLPGPTGETSLSGDQLIQEAMQEKERLEQQILDGVDGDSTYYEIRFG